MKHLCMVFVLIVVVGSLFAQTKLPMLARDDPKLGPYADVPDSATDWVAFDIASRYKPRKGGDLETE